MWQVVGQTRAVSFLQRSLERRTVAHAYLLVGPAHVGKMTLALDLAKALNCEAAEVPCGTCESCQKIAAAKHADVQIIDLAGGRNSGEAKLQTEISIDQIRELQHSASLPPFEGTFKVFIIDGAELMSHEAANSLLKTLEEPVGKVVFILLTISDRLLPATVVSRCQRLELMPLAATEIETALQSRVDIETAKAKLLAGLSHGCFGWALSAARSDEPLKQRSERLEQFLKVTSGDGEERFNYAFQLAIQFSRNREPVRETLDLWLSWWRDLLMIKASCPNLITNTDLEATLISHAQGYHLGQIRDFISSIEMALEQLKQNANPQLVLEVLMLSLPRRGE
jgi:DNA polymerase-3 subunit delta'